MAKIGLLALGGRGTTPGAPAVLAVAFDLTKAPDADFLYRPDGTTWEAEIKSGQRTIVARTTDALNRSDLLATGLEYSQQCLDIVSFEKRSDMQLAGPGGTHVVLFQRGDSLVLQQVDASTLGVGIGPATVVVPDKDGNIKKQPVPPAVWTPALRFYRLSQSSSDLYDAYRNLFLGLETLLDTLHPKEPREREEDWLLRSLTAVAQTAGLQQVLPKHAGDPAAYIVSTQYKRIRLRLFHAKPSKSPKPLDIPDPEEVTAAYESLIRIWRQIAERCLSVRPGAGGVMTYAGFKMMMDAALSAGLTMYMTNDDTPPQKSDSEISPIGKPLIPFHNTEYLGQTAPGRVALLGSYACQAGDKLPVIHRLGAKAEDKLLLIGGISGGLEISGVDLFESQQTFRLRNLGLPRTAFGEADR